MVCMGDGVCGNECDFDELCSECVDFYEYDLICYGGCCGLCGGMVWRILWWSVLLWSC